MSFWCQIYFYLIKVLLYCWKEFDSRKMFYNFLYILLTKKINFWLFFKSFSENLQGPQNWLCLLWTHSPEGHEFKSQVGEGAVMAALFFLPDPSPYFPHLSLRWLDKYEPIFPSNIVKPSTASDPEPLPDSFCAYHTWGEWELLKASRTTFSSIARGISPKVLSNSSACYPISMSCCLFTRAYVRAFQTLRTNRTANGRGAFQTAPLS